MLREVAESSQQRGKEETKRPGWSTDCTFLFLVAEKRLEKESCSFTLIFTVMVTNLYSASHDNGLHFLSSYSGQHIVVTTLVITSYFILTASPRVGYYYWSHFPQGKLRLNEFNYLAHSHRPSTLSHSDICAILPSCSWIQLLLSIDICALVFILFHVI